MLKVKKEVEEGVEVIGVKFPCLVTYTKPAWDPRYPTIKRKMAANRAEIPVLGDDAFPDIDTTRIGLKGSPTNVKKTFVPQKEDGRREDQGRGQRRVRQEAVRAAHCGQHHLKEGKHNGSQDQGPVGIC